MNIAELRDNLNCLEQSHALITEIRRRHGIRYEFLQPELNQEGLWRIAGTMVYDGVILTARRIISDGPIMENNPDAYTASLIMEIEREILRLRDDMAERNGMPLAGEAVGATVEEGDNFEWALPVFEPEEDTTGGETEREWVTVPTGEHTETRMLRRRTPIDEIRGTLGAPVEVTSTFRERQADMPSTASGSQHLGMTTGTPITPFEGSWADTTTMQMGQSVTVSSTSTDSVEATAEEILENIRQATEALARPVVRFPQNIQDEELRGDIQRTMRDMRREQAALTDYINHHNASVKNRLPRRNEIILYGWNRIRDSWFTNKIVFKDAGNRHRWVILNLQNNNIQSIDDTMVYMIEHLMERDGYQMPESLYRKALKQIAKYFERKNNDLATARNRFRRVPAFWTDRVNGRISDQGAINRSKLIDNLKHDRAARKGREVLMENLQKFTDAGLRVNLRENRTQIEFSKEWSGYQFLSRYFVPVPVRLTVTYKIADDSVFMRADTTFPSQYWHPHISSGNVCPGDYPLKEYIKQCEADYLVDAMMMILNDYNTGSPYNRLRDLQVPMVLDKETNTWVTMESLAEIYDVGESEEEDDDSYDEYEESDDEGL